MEPGVSARYPDNDQPLEDKRVLLNAIDFSTGQRAFEAELIYGTSLESLSETERAYLAIQAYALEILATEDLVGWHIVLSNWKPGTIEGSLLFQLDRIDVGPKQEAELAVLLETMQPEDYGKMIHIPTAAELAADGISPDIVSAINIALPAQLAGVKKVLAQRADSRRGQVVGYNKIKHGLVGFQRPDDHQVFIPGRVRLKSDGVHLQSVTIATSAENIRLMAGRAMATETVLNATLGAVVMSRYGVEYEAPDWARRVSGLPIWSEGKPDTDRGGDTARKSGSAPSIRLPREREANDP